MGVGNTVRDITERGATVNTGSPLGRLLIYLTFFCMCFPANCDFEATWDVGKCILLLW